MLKILGQCHVNYVMTLPKSDAEHARSMSRQLRYDVTNKEKKSQF